ncbi:MAG: DNA repair protein RecO, partial [Candidatus Caldatribacteriaceae bacterium]
MSTASRYTHDEGVVLKRMEFGEMDLILTLFTRRRGKFQVIAKGARKLGNRFGASLDLLNFCDFFLYTASGMTNLVQAKMERSFRNLFLRREKWVSGEYLLYLIDKVFEFEKPEEAVLEELLHLWEKMLTVSDAHMKCYLLTLWFRVMLLLFSGVSPQFARCVR